MRRRVHLMGVLTEASIFLLRFFAARLLVPATGSMDGDGTPDTFVAEEVSNLGSMVAFGSLELSYKPRDSEYETAEAVKT